MSPISFSALEVLSIMKTVIHGKWVAGCLFFFVFNRDSLPCSEQMYAAPLPNHCVPCHHCSYGQEHWREIKRSFQTRRVMWYPEHTQRWSLSSAWGVSAAHCTGSFFLGMFAVILLGTRGVFIPARPPTTFGPLSNCCTTAHKYLLIAYLSIYM